MNTRFLSTLVALAASVTLGANVISSGSAQAAIFDFDAVWDDNTTTEGWIEFDDAKAYQNSNYDYDVRTWWFDGLLDADFTHEGTRYGKSDLTSLYFDNYIFPESSFLRLYYGNIYNHLYISFNNNQIGFEDMGADGSPSSFSDSSYKVTDDYYIGAARSFSVLERSAKATPEPTTMAGLALVGLGLAVTRRKKAKAPVTT